jgi:hypothetical protein
MDPRISNAERKPILDRITWRAHGIDTGHEPSRFSKVQNVRADTPAARQAWRGSGCDPQFRSSGLEHVELRAHVAVMPRCLVPAL